MTRGFFGNDRDISAVMEAHEDLSAPRPAEFKGWITAHRCFVWIGGFMLHVNGKPRATLTSDEHRHFVRVGSVDMTVISEEEIEDRSKGDGLSKGPPHNIT